MEVEPQEVKVLSPQAGDVILARVSGITKAVESTICYWREPMSKLTEFVQKHAERGTCRCGRCCDHPGEDRQPEGHTVDMVFFEVSAKDEPDPDRLRELIEEHNGLYCPLDPWDGQEHSYLEVGGWIGDQGLALMLMGLGKLLGLWPIMTPKMLPGLDKGAIDQLAGAGMITIMPPEVVDGPEKA